MPPPHRPLHCLSASLCLCLCLCPCPCPCLCLCLCLCLRLCLRVRVRVRLRVRLRLSPLSTRWLVQAERLKEAAAARGEEVTLSALVAQRDVRSGPAQPARSFLPSFLPSFQGSSTTRLRSDDCTCRYVRSQTRWGSREQEAWRREAQERRASESCALQASAGFDFASTMNARRTCGATPTGGTARAWEASRADKTRTRDRPVQPQTRVLFCAARTLLKRHRPIPGRSIAAVRARLQEQPVSHGRRERGLTFVPTRFSQAPRRAVRRSLGQRHRGGAPSPPARRRAQS